MVLVTITHYVKPLINKMEPSVIDVLPATFTQFATKTSLGSMIAAQSSEIFQVDEGQPIYFRGARAQSVVYFIDGVKFFANYKHITNEELLKRFQQYNDKMAFGILYKSYLRLLLGTFTRYLKSPEDAEDLVMELYEKCLDILKSSNEIKFLKTYLFVIAKNAALGKLISKQILIEYHDLVKLEKEIEVDNQLIINNQKEIDLLNGMKFLTEEQRLCIVHFYFKKMRYKQVVEISGMDVKSVKTHLQNGKRMLKKYLLKIRNYEN